MKRILVVRLGALGDIVHALPALAALKRAFPNTAIDWLVDYRYADFLDLVPLIERRIVLSSRTPTGWLKAIKEIRQFSYDVALDLQGLLKSAVFARASGAERVVGFSSKQLREPMARVFYSAVRGPDPTGKHVIEKNLMLLRILGIESSEWTFPIKIPTMEASIKLRRTLDIAEDKPFVLINPNAGWSNKRWPPDRFGTLALWLWKSYRLPTIIVWGPSEYGRALEVVEASKGAARLAPPTTIADLVSLVREASLMVSGDSGPLHIAAALGTPIVGIYGPTAVERNGPWTVNDVTVSRHMRCSCIHRRRCYAETRCLDDITTEEVVAAVNQRLSATAFHV